MYSQTDPKFYGEDSKFNCWNQAMQVDLISFNKIGIWKLVDLIPNVKQMGCRWIYKSDNFLWHH